MILSDLHFYIFEEHNNGKRYQVIANELKDTVEHVKRIYKDTCYYLTFYLCDKELQNCIPENFVIPEKIIKKAKKVEEESKEKIKKKLTERHTFVLEQRAAGKSFHAIGNELGVIDDTARDLFYRSCRYIKDFLRGQINLEMPNDFVITEEIKEAVKQRLNIEKL